MQDALLTPPPGRPPLHHPPLAHPTSTTHLMYNQCIQPAPLPMPAPPNFITHYPTHPLVGTNADLLIPCRCAANAPLPMPQSASQPSYNPPPPGATTTPPTPKTPNKTSHTRTHLKVANASDQRCCAQGGRSHRVLQRHKTHAQHNTAL
jgi:hypothetical protein